MKKILALVLVLVFAVVAVAEAVPSKTTEDMTVIAADVNGLVVSVDANAECVAEELDVLMNETAEEYFGEEAIAEAATILGKDEVEIVEFMAIGASNYEETMGDVVLHIQCATPVAQGDKVAVLIGIENADEIAWNVYEGICAEDGIVDVQIDSETMQKLETETAYLALAI